MFQLNLLTGPCWFFSSVLFLFALGPLALSQEALRKKAQMFLGSAKDANRSEEETLSTPQPGESLRTFYQRSRESL